MPQSDLKIDVCKDARDASIRGFDWAAAPDIYSSARIEQVVVVQNGTVSGKPTVDFMIETPDGKKYVVMITGALLRAIPV